MAKIEFGVFDECQYNYFRSAPQAADIYEQMFREVQLEEQVGFRYHFVIEHQGNSVGQATSPPTLLAALAQRTSTIRIGSMIFLLPFYNPLRLAQDTATVDQLSRGRLDFGAGLGTLPHEFQRWHIPHSERREMGIEAMEVIEKAWAGEIFSYDGKYWKFDEAVPMPMPYQKPHPPIWFACQSPTTFEYAAAHNYHVAIFLDPDEGMAQKAEMWRRMWKDAGHKGPMPRIFLTRGVYVAETDEQAIEEEAPYLVQAYTWGEDRLENAKFGGQTRHNLQGHHRAGAADITV